MCQFCHQHGDGKKWYLNAANYAEDLLSDMRRQRWIARFIKGDDLQEAIPQMEKLAQAPPYVQRMLKPMVTRRAKRDHFGQVAPLEDIERIFGMMKTIVRLPCICRHTLLGREVGYCYGISMSPREAGLNALMDGLDESFLSGPDTLSFEEVDAADALAAFADHEKQGLCHTIWTFVTPFIGGLCNCDRSDCMAMRATVGHDMKVMFRGEYVAGVDPDLCTGCRSCMRLCQFGAMGYSAADQRAYVEPRACYGCGVCRSACSKNAITLTARSEVPAAAKVW